VLLTATTMLAELVTVYVPLALMLAMSDDPGTVVCPLIFAMIDQPLCLLGCPAMPKTGVWAVCPMN